MTYVGGESGVWSSKLPLTRFHFTCEPKFFQNVHLHFNPFYVLCVDETNEQKKKSKKLASFTTSLVSIYQSFNTEDWIF